MSAERPPWAQTSDIWNSISELDDDRKLRGPLRILGQANDGSIDQQLPYPDRRIALEVYENYAVGPYAKIEAYAYDQTLSPSEKHIVDSKQIGFCIGQVFNREHALDNCFSISSKNADYQTRVFLDFAYDDAGHLLPRFVDPEYNPLDYDDTTTDPLANHDLVSEHSFVLVEGLGVDASYRRIGVGGSLLDALLNEALLMLPSIRFAVSWPSASDSTDLNDPEPSSASKPAEITAGGTTTTTNGGGGSDGPRRTGQMRAEAFHRAAGFRRLGVTRFWAKRLEPSA
ncbi:hypothetical protein BFW01_g12664 [Lasiodiplodia theobromae]|uniref:uncharacterized protein n=1 Tax=Lasiodiplodia theobromae TaxID=45133 RepID=UPI0015C32331|nr:uncharacterized protein LTHEOB_7467 [Lasiodiplodia theobromae]KAF4542737.1 hypothetical protein LTHEOB_7467 [Lasiodiplodia theobromae]KAF9640858.1 hypothetical protein BFW01_g12664 [Lasiodiplodia theobromae]